MTERRDPYSPKTHLQGCPRQRTEGFEAVRPGKPNEGIAPEQIGVLRCQDCGEQEVVSAKEFAKRKLEYERAMQAELDRAAKEEAEAKARAATNEGGSQ